MLPYILAIAVASASFLLLIGAFVFPKLHRQDDFLWSGIGLFYALVLWLCAERLTGGVLLGQGAATCLLLAFGWQTVKLRRVLAYPESQTDVEGFSFTRWLGNRFSQAPRKPAAPAVTTAVTEVEEVKAQAEVEAIAEATREQVVAPAKPGLLSNIFSSRQPSAARKPTSLNAALDRVEADVALATEEFEEDWESEAVSETVAIASDVPAVSGETVESVLEPVIVEETEAVESVVVEAAASSAAETVESVIVEETEAVEPVVVEAAASSAAKTVESVIVEETEAVESVVVEAEASSNEPATVEAVITEKAESQDS